MGNTKKKANFLERLLAYIIDVFIVVILSTIISIPFTDGKIEDVQRIDNEINILNEKFYANEVEKETYLAESSSLSYELANIQKASTIITILIYIMYYILFQYYNKGQTIGKKLLKIKVVSSTSNLTMNQLILREILIYNILIAMMGVALIYFNVGSFTYFYVVAILEFIQFVFIAISVFMIIFSKKNRALHDCIAQTDVVKI